MPTTLRAFTSSPRRRSLTSALNCFARLARTAAGRACRPDAFEITSGPELTIVADRRTGTARSRHQHDLEERVSAGGNRCPARGIIELTRSSDVIRTGVSRLFACVARYSASKSISGVADLDVVADSRTRRESLSFQVHGVEPDVHEDLDARDPPEA